MAATYFGAAKLGLALAFDSSSVTAIWPPTGVALAALLIWGPRMWPAVSVGAFLANATTAGSLVAVLGITTGNTLEAVLGAFLLGRVGFRHTLERMRDVAALVLLAGVLSTAVSASIGVFSLWADGLLSSAAIGSTWRVWWLGDMGGDLLIAPAILILAARPRISWRPAWFAEAACVAVGLTLLSAVVFNTDSPLAYAVFPLLFWTALRFRQPGAVVAGLIVSGFAVWYTVHGHGPFFTGSPDANLLRAQTFVGVATVSALLVAAVRTEGKAASDAERRLAEAQQISHLGSWEWLIDANEVSWSAELYRIYGVDPAAFGASYEGYLELVHRDDRERVGEVIAEALADGEPFAFEHRIVRPDREVRTVQSRGEVISDASGRPSAMNGTAQDVTEHKRNQRSLRESERHLADAQELGALGSWEWDVDADYVKWSAQLSRIAGFAAGENPTTLAGFLALVHDDDRARTADVIEQARADGVSESEYRLVRPDGDVRWVHGRRRTIYDVGGAAVRMSGTLQDITEHRRERSELARAARYFELSRDLVCTAGIDGFFKQTNPAWQEVLGWSEMELLSRPFVQFVHPDDRESTEPQPAGLETDGVTVNQFVNRYATKDGGWRWIDWNTMSVPADGLIYATGRDITQSKAAAEALDASQRQTRLILETAHDAFVAIDAGGLISDWNPQAEAIFGWPRDEALGRDLADTIIPSSFRTAHRQGLQRFLATGEGKIVGQRLELSALHRSGREFPVELTISVVGGGGGYSFNAFVRDISERKRTEAELSIAHDEVLEASRAKSAFVANTSHEIRTPLNGVIGMAELLLDTALDDEQREYAAGVRTSGDALMKVIDDILDFSKIEAGKLELDSGPFDVRRVVADVSSLVTAVAHKKQIKLTYWIDEALPRVACADGNRISQVLTNLMTNALKFTADGSVTVHVTGAPPQPAEPARLRFEVTDTGIGIEHADLARIFDAFSQADASTTRHYGGTGLGLAISKQLVDLMGGDIGVDSTPGEGSTFFFEVPLEPVAHDAPPIEPDESGYARALAVDAHANPATHEIRGTGRPILVAEDSPVNQLVMVRMLQKRGLNVEVAANGREALDMYRPGRYAAIFMDCQMPELDGYEATRQIRRREGADHHTPIIAMTANSMMGDGDHCLAAGMDEYLGKPVTQVRLTEVLARTPGIHDEGDAPPPAVGPTPLLDGSVLAEISDGDGQACDELVRLFLEDSADKVAQLTEAVGTRDAKTVETVAHGLKGSSAVVGAGQLAEISGQLCDAVRTDRLRDTPRLQAALQASYELTSGAMRRQLRPRGSTHD